MLHRLKCWLSPDLAIDLGTANTLIAVQGEGVVLDEPSVVALQKGTRQILGRGTAVGKLARQMLGRTPDSITTVKPIQNGAIADFKLCESMLRYFIQKAVRATPGFRPNVVIAVSGGISNVEKRAVFNSAERAGAGRVFLIAESKAASIGAGLPIAEPLASLICDIGAGTTEVAVLSLTEIVVGKSLRIAGDEFDQAIINHLKQNFSLRIGEQTAEQLKIRIGCAYPLDEERTGEVRGLDSVCGIPRRATITSEELRDAIRGPLEAILNSIKNVIEQCDPELVADLSDTGLVLSGGGALLPGLDLYFREQLGIPVRVASDPQRAVVRGAAICVEHLDQWKESLETSDENV
ncbi:MAG: rod shape-determining protein [Planctomycetales bacterium]|jgi:rod shape-determining protein MreB|nr:rod shape-determining protein [Planctomycetales bacterium]